MAVSNSLVYRNAHNSKIMKSETKLESRHTCCICGKKRNASKVQAVTWRYYPFPNKLVSFVTYACNGRFHWRATYCVAKLEVLKIKQSAP